MDKDIERIDIVDVLSVEDERRTDRRPGGHYAVVLWGEDGGSVVLARYREKAEADVHLLAVAAVLLTWPHFVGGA